MGLGKVAALGLCESNGRNFMKKKDFRLKFSTWHLRPLVLAKTKAGTV